MANAIASSSKPSSQEINGSAHHHQKQLRDGDDLRAEVAETAARFAIALESDHSAVLRPDYITPFEDVRDVIGRLLPYHVWNVPDRELRWALKQPVVASKYRSAAPTNGEVGAEPARKRMKTSIEQQEEPPPSPLSSSSKGKGKELEGSLQCEGDRAMLNAKEATEEAGDDPVAASRVGQSEEGMEEEAFPPLALCTSFLDRHAALLEQLQAVRLRFDGAHELAPSHDVQSLQIERLAWHTNMQAYTHEYRDLLDKRDACVHAGMSFSQLPQLRTTRTRPDIPNFESRVSRYRGWAGGGSQSPTGVSSPGAYAQRQTSYYPNGNSTPQQARPPGASPPTSVQIPKHPIPIIIPFSTLARLAAYNITPVPSPHVQAALTPERNLGSGAANLPLIAPQPPRNDQGPSVMLMGITAPSATVPIGGQTSEKNLHISVVLSKLTSPQLSGLAEIMQNLQNAGKQAAAQGAQPPPTPAA